MTAGDPQISSLFRVTIAGGKGGRSGTFRARSASQVSIGADPDHLAQGGSTKTIPIRAPFQTSRIRIEVPVSPGRSETLDSWWKEITDSSKPLSKRTVDIVYTDSAGKEGKGHRLKNAWPCKVGATALEQDSASGAFSEFYEFVYESIEELSSSPAAVSQPAGQSKAKEEQPTKEAPSTAASYETVALISNYIGEDRNEAPAWKNYRGPTNVKYFNEQEREACRLTIKDGKIYDSSGNLYDTGSNELTHGENRTGAIFVMDQHGGLFATNQQKLRVIHHSSLLAGEPVAFAGEITVKNGELTYVSNQSGHYKPPPKMFDSLSAELEKGGIDIEYSTKVEKIVAEGSK